MLVVKPISLYPEGTLEKLLKEAYDSLHQKFPELADENNRKFHECDEFFYHNPQIGESCSFVSEWNNELCGMFSWDPRNYPVVIIGHNCIKPDCRERGLGKEQLLKALTIFRAGGFKTAKVSTGGMDFFIPAQRMYVSAGFREVKRETPAGDKEKLHAVIFYELPIG